MQKHSTVWQQPEPLQLEEQDASDGTYLFKYFLIMQAIVYFESGAIPALLNELKADFEMSFSEQGALGGLVYLFLSATCPVAGWAFRVLQPKLVLALAAVGTCITAFIIGITPAGYSTLLILARSSAGITQAFFMVYDPVWVDEFAPQSVRTKWMSALQASVPVGIMLGYLLATLVTIAPACAIACWRLPFLIQAAVGIPLAVGAFFVPSEHLDVKAHRRLKELSEAEYSDLEEPYWGRRDSMASIASSVSAHSFALPIDPAAAIGLTRELLCPAPVQIPVPSPSLSCPPSPALTFSVTSTPPRPLLSSYSPVLSVHAASEEDTAEQWRHGVQQQQPLQMPHVLRTSASEDTPLFSHLPEDSAPYPSELSPAVTQHAFQHEEEPCSPSLLPEPTTAAAAAASQQVGEPTYHSIVLPSRRKRRSLATPSPLVATLTFTQALQRLLDNRVYVSLVIALSGLYFVVTGIQFWATDFLISVIGGDRNTVRLLFIITSVTAPLLGVFLGGWIIDLRGGYQGDFQQADALRTCAIFGLLGACFAIPVTYLNSLGIIVVALWFLLFFGGALLPAATGVMISVIHPELRPFSSSLSVICFNTLGYFMGPIVSGWVMQATNSFRKGFRAILVVSILSLLFLWLAWRFSLRRALRRAARGHTRSRIIANAFISGKPADPGETYKRVDEAVREIF